MAAGNYDDSHIFDDLPGEEVLLEPRRSKGPGSEPTPRLTVGGPIAVPLDDDAIDSADHELRSFIDHHEAATHAYWLVRLNCTFRANDEEPFSRAWVNITLTREDSQPELQPLAWSMRPLSLLQVHEIPWTIKIGLNAKILNAEAEWHPSGKTRPAVLAMGELEPNPGWDFSATDSSPLVGVQRLALVLRAPYDITTVGELSVDAIVRRRRFGLIPHSGRFPTNPAALFRIPLPGAACRVVTHLAPTLGGPVRPCGRR